MTMDRDPNVYNRENEVYAQETKGSNTLAYVIGGLVVALGLVAFLFYDGGGTTEPSTTGSTNTTQTDRPAASPTGPGAPSNAPAAPASPITPMTPSSPAPAQQ